MIKGIEMKEALILIKNVAVGVIVALAVVMVMITMIAVNTVGKTNRTLFGYTSFVVLTDSMARTDFSAGDIILTKKVDPTTLRPGDIITFVAQSDSNFGRILSHKIRSIDVNRWGELEFTTYGTTTGVNDEGVVTPPYILGQYVVAIPRAGELFNWLRSTAGYVLCVFIPFLYLICLQIYNCVVLLRELKEVMANRWAIRLSYDSDILKPKRNRD